MKAVTAIAGLFGRTLHVGRHRVRIGPRQWLAGVLAVLLATSGGAWALLAGPDASQAAPAAGTLTKTVINATTGSTTQAAPGDTLKYTISARNDSGEPADISVTDPLDPNQKYVPGSLKTPTGWTPSFSTDGGATYATTEPASGVTNLKVDGQQVPSGSRGGVVDFEIPSKQIVAGQEVGDGFKPILWEDRVYNLPHHRAPQHGLAGIQCRDKFTGVVCPGWTDQGKTISLTAGAAFGTGVDDQWSAWFNWHMMDQDNGRVWVAVGQGATNASATTVGVACLDLDTESTCGFFPLATNAPPGFTAPGAPFNNQAGLAGGASIGTKFYPIDWLGRLHCFDTATQAACGTPVTVLPTLSSNSDVGTIILQQAVAWDDRYVFAAISPGYGVAHQELSCYDTQANAICPGYPKPAFAALNERASTLAPVLSAGGAVTGVCAQVTSNTHPDMVFQKWDCYDVNGAAVAAPNYGAPMPGDRISFGNHGGPLRLGNRVYFPNDIGGPNNPHQGSYPCYDATINAPCAGYTVSSTGADVRPYALTQDPDLTQCIWVVGDGGIFEVFDKDTGQFGCSQAYAKQKVKPAIDLCNPAQDPNLKWAYAKIIDVARTDYASALVTIYDKNGDVVTGFDMVPVDANGNVDLSSIPLTGDTSELEVEILVKEPNDKFVTPGARMEVAWTGITPQICFETTVKEYCAGAVADLTNEATGVFTIRSGQSAQRSANTSLKATGGVPCPPVQIDKRVSTPPRPVPGQPGVQRIVYDVTVTYPAAAIPTTYNLEDRFKFAGAVTVTAATAANVAPGGLTSRADWNGVSQPIVATNVPIAVNATHLWRMTVDFTVGAGAGGAAGDCTLQPGETGTGLLNEAKVISNGGSDTADDCAPLPQVTLEKKLVDAKPDASGKWTVTYDVTVTNPGASSTTYTLDDQIKFGSGITVSGQTVTNTTPGGLATNPNWNGFDQITVASNVPIVAGATHVYRVTATATLPGTLPPAAGDCTLAQGETGTGFLNTATLTSPGGTLTDDDCAPAGTVGIIKKLVDATPTGGNNWTITYDVTATNSGPATTYDLTDEIKFGAGISVTSGTVTNTTPGGIVTNTGWNGTSVTNVVTAQAIAANAVHVYRVTVNATVPTTITGGAADCTLQPGETGTGFLNKATVTAGGSSSSAEDCAPPTVPAVKLDKRLISATKSGNDWTIVYDVQVANTTARATTYDLDDQLRFGAGITVSGATIVNTVPGGIATNPAWNGVSTARVVTGQALAANASHTYRVTARATVPPAITDPQADCTLQPGETGTGFLNTATATSNGQTLTADACATPKGPNTTITKKVTAANALAGGQWQITYDVVVANSGGDGTYTLDDQLQFGAGITVNNASIANTVPGGITTNPGWNGTSAVRVVTDQAITDGASHTYVVTVTATVPTTVTPGASDCALSSGETGTGFLNKAMLTANGQTSHAEDCATPQPGNVTLVKRLTGATAIGNGQWRVEYDIVAANVGATATTYNLADHLKFGAGITVVNATIANTAPGGITTDPSWNGIDKTNVVTGQALAVGASHTYHVVATATVATTLTPEAGNCTLTAGETGTGFLNTATMTVDGKTLDASDCASPNGSNVVITKKLVSSQLNNGNWDVAYDVTVTNQGPAATTYTLADRLQFGAGITVSGQTIANTTPGGITTRPDWNGLAQPIVVTDQDIAANVTHVYRVTVKAAVPGSVSAEAADCTLQPGETGTGFLNKANVTWDGQDREATDCGSPNGPDIGMTKTLTEAKANGGGKWTVTYEVVVTNRGAIATTYALTDKIKYGAGMTIDSATITNTAPGGIPINPSWNGVSDLNVATGVSIDPGARHTYKVVVNTTVPTTVTPGASDCTLSAGETGTGFLNEATATAGGRTVTDDDCGSPTDANVTIVKKVVSTTPQAGDKWQVTYDVTVTNAGAADTTYNLTDQLKFGAGITVDSAQIANTTPGGITTNPAWNGQAVTSVVTGQAIAAAAVHVYRVTVVATVPSATPPTATDCQLTPGEPGTGFLNTAKVTAGGVDREAEDCSTPAGPNVTMTKVLKGAVKGADGKWTVTYDVTVTNAGAAPTTYTLDDELKYGTGVTVESATVANTAPGGIATNPAWNGTSQKQVVSNQAINGGVTHLYLVTVVAAVANTITPEAGDCTLQTGETGTGFLNRATMTTNGSTVVKEDCGSPTGANPTIDKSLVSATKGTGNTWKVIYRIVVTNTGAAGTYTLDDELKFGAGITVSTAQVANTAPGGITTNPAWNGVSDQRIVTNQAIAASATHAFQVTVDATVPTTLTPEAGDCTLTTGETGTGFLNKATMTVDNTKREATACGTPSTPTVTIEKKLTSSTKTGPQTWKIVYDVTVRNTGAAPTVYDLADRLRYGTGITVDAASVVNVQPGSIVTNPQWNGVAVTGVVTDQAIAANATHLYRVTVDATVATTLTTEAGDCTLTSTESGTGFLNEGTLTAGGSTTTVKECGSPNTSTVTIDKKVTGPATALGNNQFQVSYDVTVVNTGKAASTYTLTDQLRFGAGITIDAATIANATPGGITTNPAWNGIAVTNVVTGQSIAAGATHVYRVTARTTVATTVTTEASDCALASNESGTGFMNSAKLTVDGTTTEKTACTTPETGKPGVTVDKNRVGAPKPLGSGKYEIVYDITARNSGTATKYTLTDQLKFGAGVTVNSAKVTNTAPGGITTRPGWNGRSDTTVVSNQDIAAGATHLYRVTVQATVAGNASAAATDCTLAAGEKGTGFLNEAKITADGQTSTDTDCGSPGGPPRPLKPVHGNPGGHHFSGKLPITGMSSIGLAMLAALAVTAFAVGGAMLWATRRRMG